MRINSTRLAALLAAGMTAGLIVGGPTAAAGPLPIRCVLGGSGSCQPSPEVPFSSALPVIPPDPHGDAARRQGGH